MSAPQTWQNMPMSQTDATTIAEFIAAEIAAHNTDPNSHYDAGAAMDIHRSADIIDHPPQSVQASTITIDVVGVGEKAGVVPPAGVNWTAAETVPSGTFYAIEFGEIGSVKYCAVGGAGGTINSANGNTWDAGGTIDSGDWDMLKFGNNCYVAASANTGTNRLAYSTDGITWHVVAGHTEQRCTFLLFDGTKFIAGLYDFTGGTFSGGVYSSTDGATWTALTTGYTDNIGPFAFADIEGGIYFGVIGNKYGYSYDCVTWSTWDFGDLFAPAMPCQIGNVLYGALSYEQPLDDGSVVMQLGYQVARGIYATQTPATFGSNFGPSENRDSYCIFPTQDFSTPAIYATANGSTFVRADIAVDGDIWDLASSEDRFLLVTNASSGTRIAYSDIPH